jgi:hypothetical protein
VSVRTKNKKAVFIQIFSVPTVGDMKGSSAEGIVGARIYVRVAVKTHLYGIKWVY